jgi:hypothetical protein
MGYYSDKEIENVIEEPDRIDLGKYEEYNLAPRKIKNHRRETYRAQNYWVVRNLDMALLFAMIPMSFALGVLITVLVVSFL